MTHEELVKWISDMRLKGHEDEDITAMLKKAGHRDDEINQAFQDAPTPKRQQHSNKHLRAAVLLVIILLIGIGVFVIRREMAPPTEEPSPATSPFISYYAFRNAYSKNMEPGQATIMQAAALEFEQKVKEGCPLWEECSSDVVAKYVMVKMRLGLSPEEILADEALHQELLFRKEHVRGWMDDYLATGNDALFVFNLQRVRFSLDALNDLDLLTDEEREQWIVDLARIQPPRAKVALRRGDLIRFLGHRLDYASFDKLRPLYGMDYDEAYQSVCDPISLEEIKPASGYMVAYLYLRVYCGMPLSAKEVAALKQTIDSLGTDDESEYLKFHFQKFV